MARVRDIVCFKDYPNSMKKIESRLYNGAGTYAAITTAVTPPFNGGSCLHLGQHKTGSWFQGVEYTPAADKDILLTGFVQFGAEWPPSGGGPEIYPFNIADGNGTGVCKFGVARVSDTQTRIFVDDLDGEVGSANDVFTSPDTWYLVQMRLRVANPANLEVRTGRVSGNSIVDYGTKIVASNCNFGTGNMRAHLRGQGYLPLTYATETYFSDVVLLDEVDDDSTFWPQSHTTYVWGPDLDSATPHYNQYGTTSPLDDLAGSSKWKNAGDGQAFTTADYANQNWGCVRVDGPYGSVPAGVTVLGAEWLYYVYGELGKTIVDALYGKAAPGGAGVTKVTTNIGMLGFHRFVQDANAPSGNRVPDPTQYGVIGHGNKDTEGAENVRAIEERVVVLLKRPAGAVAPLCDHHYRMRRAG